MHPETEDCFSFSPQRAMIFRDTLLNNLTAYDRSISDERLQRAYGAAMFTEVIEHRKDGFQEMTAQDGMNLSGGERKRLSLARALARGAGVYVLDDPFSALDAVTAKKAYDGTSAFLKGKTLIVVSQKINDVANADSVVMMDNGRIIAQGTHAELPEECREYRV